MLTGFEIGEETKPAIEPCGQNGGKCGKLFWQKGKALVETSVENVHNYL